jgi:hypothetical protein
MYQQFKLILYIPLILDTGLVSGKVIHSTNGRVREIFVLGVEN